MGAYEDVFSPSRGSAESNEEPAEEQEPQETSATEPSGEAAPAAEQGSAGEAEKPKQETSATESTTEAKGEPSHVPLAALHEERKRRQELATKVAELEAFKAAAMQLAPKPEPPKKQEPEEDEESRFYRDPVGFQKSLIKQAVEDIERKNFQIRVEQSKRRLQTEVQDYEAAEAEFLAVVERDDNLRRQVFAHPDPARFAYEIGRTILETRGIGSISDYRKKVEAEVEARLRAEFEAKAKTQTPQHEDDTPPPSPGTVRGVSGSTRVKPEPNEDEFFSSVFVRKPRRQASAR